ncbi:MAG: transposase [Planctomycetes bacterium]|nr:transposase [Planctomycetota bacterium]
MAALNCDEHADLPVRQVFACLLDQGVYLCAIRTMYRLLARNAAVRERRDQLRHPTYKRPELRATAPNQVWSWDITKLLGPEKWTYYHLYVLLDIFSRYVVGWMVASCESAELAKRLIGEAYERQGITPGQIVVHADRGASMTSKPLALLYADLGINQSHSRPHVSNDNPYSEALFKTGKYRPDFPDRFGSIEHARTYCGSLFDWYNHQHYHTGIALLTPAVVHHGRVDDVLAVRNDALARAYADHPERFARAPRAKRPPPAVWINPPHPIEIGNHGLPGHPDPRSSILGHPANPPLRQIALNPDFTTATPTEHSHASARSRPLGALAPTTSCGSLPLLTNLLPPVSHSR